MAEATISPEVSAKASLPRETGAPPEADTLSRVRKELEKEKNTNISEQFQKERRAQDVFNEGTRKILFDANFGTERNPDGTKKRDSATEQRFKQASQSEQLSRELVEKGYDSLTPTQKNRARAVVERAISINPILKDQLPTDPVRKEEVLVKVLKDPELAHEIIAAYSERVDPTQKLQDQVSEVKQKLEETTKSEKDKKIELRDTTTSLGENSHEIARFDLTADKGIELTQLTTELPGLKEDLENKNNELRLAEENIAIYKQQMLYQTMAGNDTSKIEAALQEAIRQAGRVRGEKTAINIKINRHSSLIEEKRKLESERTSLEQKKLQLSTELTGITKERVRLQAEFATAQMTRESEEEQFVNGVNGILSEATFRYLQEQLTKADNAQRKVVEEMLQKATSETEKKYLTGLLSRYERPKSPTILDSRKTQPNTYNIDSDTTILLSNDPTLGGPEGLLRKQLLDQGLTAAQVDEQMANKEFVEKMQPRAVESLLSAKLKSGKLSADEAEKIIRSPWGEGMIDKAIQGNQKIKDTIESLRAQGKIKGDLKEMLRAMDKQSLLSFLLLILGAAALGVVGVGAVGAAGKALSN